MPRIALFDSEADNAPKSIDIAWERLGEVLAKCRFTPCLPCKGHDCLQKYGRAWSPVSYAEGAPRGNDGVEEISYAVFDLDDNPTPEEMAGLGQRLDGYAYIVHQTHSGSFRLVLALSEPVPVANWERVWPALCARFQLPKVDQACSDPARIFFTPSRPEGSDYKYFTGVGRPVSWRSELELTFPGGAAELSEIFSTSVNATREQYLAVPERAGKVETGPIDLEALRRAVKSMRNAESRQLLDTILGGRKLTEHCPKDIGYRDTMLQRAASLLATAPLGKPYATETVQALIEPSMVAAGVEPEGLDHWMAEFRNKYERAIGRRLENDARSDATRAALMEVLGDNLPPEEDSWRRELLYVVDAKGDKSGLRQVGANINLILQNDPNFKSFIRFNEVTKELDISGGILAGVPRASLETEAANWLARSDYRLFVKSYEVGEQLLAVGRANAYDPLREYLLECGKKWDGKPRISKFFSEYFTATSTDEALLDRISECFLISCAARGLQPGAEVQTIPVLSGGQGEGKTRSIKALGAPYFTNSKINMNDKDAALLASRAWVIELAELASLRVVDLETIKNFTTQNEDLIRPPYGRAHELFARRCIFVGTTNQEEFLYDETGNRRFWPVKVGKCYPERIAAERDQLFGEAVVRYQRGEQWWLNKDEQARAEVVSSAFMTPSHLGEQILGWFLSRDPERRPKELTSYDCAHVVLGLPSERCDDKIQRACARALKLMKFTRSRRRLAGVLYYYYVTPERIMKTRHTTALPEGMEVLDGNTETGS